MRLASYSCPEDMCALLTLTSHLRDVRDD